MVRELSALRSIASRASPAKNIGTGARRISEPLPADIASVGPENGSPVPSKRTRAPRVVPPMSKHSPVDDRYPCLNHRR